MAGFHRANWAPLLPWQVKELLIFDAALKMAGVRCMHCQGLYASSASFRKWSNLPSGIVSFGDVKAHFVKEAFTRANSHRWDQSFRGRFTIIHWMDWWLHSELGRKHQKKSKQCKLLYSRSAKPDAGLRKGPYDAERSSLELRITSE